MYVAQLLPDRPGAMALRKLMAWAIAMEETKDGNLVDQPLSPQFTQEEIDELYALNAKLTNDMRAKR